MKYTLINADCLAHLNKNTQTWDTIFCDPPDNIGLDYKGYDDNLKHHKYIELMSEWLNQFIRRSTTVWFSYNAKWTFAIAPIINGITHSLDVSAKLCIQTFTFGQYNQHDLGNSYRPLLRLHWNSAPLYPDAIRISSWRQKHGDKRACREGRVPDDIFDFPRVVGNSKQRRKWHPTQLNEGLVERCIKLTTPEGGSVLDPFAGTGTTLRVCERINRHCTLIELDPYYCDLIAVEHEKHGIKYEHD